MNIFEMRLKKYRDEQAKKLLVAEQKLQAKEEERKAKAERRERIRGLIKKYREEQKNRKLAVSVQPLSPGDTQFVRRFARCFACCDLSTREHNGRTVCTECYAELAHGIVKNANIIFFGGLRNRNDDDIGPWQENAIRALEDQ